MHGQFFFKEYVQEIGRCGRDGNQATAVMFFNNSDTAVRNVHSAVKDYIKATQCRRQILCANFQSHYVCGTSQCCDLCMAKDFTDLQVANETQLFMLRCMIDQYLKSHPTIILKIQNIIDMLDTAVSAEDIELVAGVETSIAKDIFDMFSFVLSHSN